MFEYWDKERNRGKVAQFQTRSNGNLRQNFSDIFTAKAATTVIDLDLELSINPDKVVLKSQVLSPDTPSDPETWVLLSANQVLGNGLFYIVLTYVEVLLVQSSKW